MLKEYEVVEASPYTGEMSAKEIKASSIDWKPGKDVTVEKAQPCVRQREWLGSSLGRMQACMDFGLQVAKKVKGGG